MDKISRDLISAPFTNIEVLRMNEDLRNTLLELLAPLDDERLVWEPNGFISVLELKKWVKTAE